MPDLELFSKKDCKLCDEAKTLVERVNREYRFAIKETVLAEPDKRFAAYAARFPVIVASNGKEISGRISEGQVRDLFLSLTAPPRIFYVAKFLEALAIVAVLFGLIYGFLGDMWTDLYFFLGGIVVFIAGWSMEKWEIRTRKGRNEKGEEGRAKFGVGGSKLEVQDPKFEARSTRSAGKEKVRKKRGVKKS